MVGSVFPGSRYSVLERVSWMLKVRISYNEGLEQLWMSRKVNLPHVEISINPLYFANCKRATIIVALMTNDPIPFCRC